MAFLVDENGDITMVQGDSGSLVVVGLNTDKNYKVYFAIQDKDRKPIGAEIAVDSNKSGSVIFEVTASLTDLLVVDKDKKTAKYYYGIKSCDPDNGYEDTLLIANREIGEQSVITVYPKKVEGV